MLGARKVMKDNKNTKLVSIVELSDPESPEQKSTLHMASLSDGNFCLWNPQFNKEAAMLAVNWTINVISHFIFMVEAALFPQLR